MITTVTCPVCNETGSANNPQAFYDPGETAEISHNCFFCDGRGEIDIENPLGIRAAVLVAREIKSSYPNFSSWAEIYSKIGTNISNGLNAHLSNQNARYSNLLFEKDVMFSDDPLPIDTVIKSWIKKGNYIEEAKTILGILII